MIGQFLSKSYVISKTQDQSELNAIQETALLNIQFFETSLSLLTYRHGNMGAHYCFHRSSSRLHGVSSK